MRGVEGGKTFVEKAYKIGGRGVEEVRIEDPANDRGYGEEWSVQSQTWQRVESAPNEEVEGGEDSTGLENR